LRGRIAVVAVLGLAACSTPIGIESVGSREAYRELTESALSSDRPSRVTLNTLRARDLIARAKEDPDGVLHALHELVLSGAGGPAEIFALAELSYLQGARTRKREHYLAATLYAWSFLFPGAGGVPPDHFDPRTRMACDLYNRALVAAFRADRDDRIEPRGGVWELPFARLEIELPEEELRWANRRLIDFLDLSEIEVRGMRNQYRIPGLGAPLAARTAPPADDATDDLVGPRVLAPVSLVLRLEDERATLHSAQVRGRLEIFALNEVESFQVGDQRVPLEVERTAAMAATLSNPLLWKSEIWGFLGRFSTEEAFDLPLLRATAPHAPGRIPVVFVHGTASSAGRWADMFNDLWSESGIRQRFEPWFFMYDTGNPIAYSGALLREKLTAAVARLDALEQEPCLHQMVVIGHSQGGLLTKLTAVETGDRLWKAISKKPLAELKISEDTRELLDRAFFLEPLPFVRRVIFIATPHRGSYQALRNIAGWVTRFIRMPGRLAGAVREISLNSDSLRVAGSLLRVPSAIDNMREGNPFLMGLGAIPVAPGIARHSIIPVLGDGPLEKGRDGVVEYRSAHIDDVDSELVVHSGHSTQGLPATIEEVRRILQLHADTLAESGLVCGARVSGP
jgi:pimeloyl-ACP methyl ester carboxylesterase